MIIMPRCGYGGGKTETRLDETRLREAAANHLLIIIIIYHLLLVLFTGYTLLLIIYC